MDPPFHSQSRNTRELARTEFCLLLTELKGLDLRWTIDMIWPAVFWQTFSFVGYSFLDFKCCTVTQFSQLCLCRRPDPKGSSMFS
jgi:hypothetical protein